MVVGRSSNLTALLESYGLTGVSGLSEEAPEEKTFVEWLDDALVKLANASGPVRVTGWTTSLEGYDEDGNPFLYHLFMPEQPTWRSEGMIRASLDEVKHRANAERLASVLFGDDDEEDEY